MQVTEIDANGLKHEFKVVIPASQLEARTLERLTEISRTVQMPGFRPGKVPMKIVRQKYGNSVMGEVMEQVVNEGAQAAISQKELRPAVQPKVEITGYSEGADLEIKVVVEVLPEIKFMDFAGIDLERETAPVPDSEVDEAIGRIAEHHEGSEAVDRASASGDTVVIDFLGKLDGVAFSGGTGQDYSLKLGSNTFIPGFEDQLIGKKAGDDVVVKVTFPEAYGNAELAGKAVEFDVKVKEVRAPQAAVLDDAFAQKLGLETLDALRVAVRDEIGRELSNLSRGRLKRKLLDVLAANHDFPVPGSMVDHEFDAIWKQIEDDRKAGRTDPTDAGKTDDELKAEYRSLSERRVRLGLLLADVGRTNNINVTQEDLNKALMDRALREKLGVEGTRSIKWMSPNDYSSLIKSNQAMFRRAIDIAGIKPE